MERFPTWRVWRLIHRFPPPEMFTMYVHLLRIKRTASGYSRLSNVWTWIVISLLTNLVTSLGNFYIIYSIISLTLVGNVLPSLSFLIPVFITLICLRIALRITHAVAMQREIGNYDLFALLPAGEFTNILNIARAFRHPLQGVFIGSSAALVILALLWFVVANFPLGFGNNFLGYNGTLYNGTLYMGLPIMLRGVTSFIDYLQSFVAAILIAIIASQRQKRGEAQLWVTGGFIALQIALYVIVNGVGWIVSNYLVYGTTGASGAAFMFTMYSTYIAVQSLFLIACRELINAALWLWLRRQMDA